ncbi:MAG TPA: class I SAM-dependent methyltransferase [Candidatus Ruania gallistercoris]|uniref:Class I SAM-dependent methyltransferase n=1 Tax=Candidatus Ruania gallistercoris TaxID=2838746 RepID=A0A9D2EDU9_9MICO|nr:class I SAM-dependent methyltransferase [Candidatus Ruania gallistercoris]
MQDREDAGRGEPPAEAGYRDVDGQQAAAATISWWSHSAAEYLAEHGSFLGPADFCWCPEGVRESEAHLLGDLELLRSRQVLEVGAGAAQCSRWLRGQGVEALATEPAAGMVAAAAELDAATGIPVPMVQADARELPLADACVDVVFTAFGALSFVPDTRRVHAEVARVLRPGGQWVFSVTHPLRWAFPDDPSAAGLTAHRSYFDRRPYVESDSGGRPLYAEYHRTIGDHVRDVVGAGLTITDLIEPEWPAENTNVWGGWGPERGALLPGTLIVRAELR